eukprot:jgi/Bigna1/140685/aug1.57_g15393
MRKFDRDIPGLPPLKDSRSHEMIRHCTVQDYTILGGLSKLIKTRVWQMFDIASLNTAAAIAPAGFFVGCKHDLYEYAAAPSAAIITNDAQDIVTFSCMDWSDGQNYLKLGFTITERIPPYCFWINQTGKVRTYERQLPESLFEEFKEEITHKRSVRKQRRPGLSLWRCTVGIRYIQLGL